MRPLGVPRRDGDRLRAGISEGRGHRLRSPACAEDEHAGSLGFDEAYDRRAVRARPEHAAVADDERVHRPGAGSHVVELVAVADDGGLVRNGHVRAREAKRLQAGHGLLEPLPLHGQRHVRPVERDRGEGGVLHER